MKKNLLNSILIFVGLMLSPVTWWNDPFVNIPISYIAACLIAHINVKLFSISFILFYWFSNILGIFMLYVGSRGVVKDEISKKNQTFTIIIYSILILLLSIYGILKPVILR